MRFFSSAIVLALLFISVRVNAADLYVASAQKSPGELLIIDPATGATITDIGPLNDSTARNFGMTGMAFDPVSGVLYGSSANGNPDASTRGQLVKINPATGLVTPIGNFNLPSGGTMTDLAFDPTSNILYGISSNGGANLYSINTTTAQPTLIGQSGLDFTNGGGLAIDSTGVFFGSPLVPDDGFGTYDKTTGLYTNIANPAQPNARGYGALSFNGSVLYGIEVGTASHLVTFDTTTGAVTDIGATTATNLDGLAFRPTTALAGDYNHDGKVTAADYVIWKNGGSPNPNSPADYATWKANFGASAGSGTGLSSSAVPEPTATTLLAAVFIFAFCRTRKPH